MKLRGREHSDPLRLNNGTEATNESSCLVFDLSVHSKMRHQMDVANSVTRKRHWGLAGQGRLLPKMLRDEPSVLEPSPKHKHQHLSAGDTLSHHDSNECPGHSLLTCPHSTRELPGMPPCSQGLRATCTGTGTGTLVFSQGHS